jgi:nucleoid-associated protein YgaU
MSRKSNFARKARQAKRRRQSSVKVEERPKVVMLEETPKVENTCVSKVEDTCVSIDQARENLAAKLRQSALALHDNGKPRIDFERVCKLSRADWKPLDTPDKIYFDYFFPAEAACLFIIL